MAGRRRQRQRQRRRRRRRKTRQILLHIFVCKKPPSTRLASPRLVNKTLGGSFNLVNKYFFNSLTYPGQISYVLSTNSMTIGSINQPKKSWKSKYDDMLSIWTQGRCIRWMDPQSYDLPSIIDLQLMRTFNDTPWQSPPGGPPLVTSPTLGLKI